VVTARRLFWVVVLAVAAFYALGIHAPFWSLLVQAVPALLWFRVPSRSWFVVVLVAPLLAGYGLQWLLMHRPRRGQLLALVGAVVALVFGGFLIVNVPAVNGLAVLVGGAGVSVVAWLAFTRKVAGTPLALAFTGIMVVELVLTGQGWLEWRTEAAWLPPPQVRLAERLTELDAFRVYSPTYSLQQQVAEAYNLRLFGGVDPFQISGIVSTVEQGSGVEHFGYSVVLPPLVGVVGDDLSTANQGADPNTSVLGQWGVTHVVSAVPLDLPTLQLVDQIEGVYLYANLDPALNVVFPESPAWVYDQAALPDRQTVTALNRWTAVAALVSGIAFVVLLAAATKVRA
jgi:hypothetical protein